MNDDAELLCRYADEGSESAFTELVQRHVNLVYGAALRRTGGDPHRAADVAQQVFTNLARNARKLSRHALLPAWLHTATRNAALNLMISEQRRQTRETEALALDATSGGAGPDWNQLRPLLDAAIDELPEADRTAVILRFLERRPFAEIGATLQVSEDAARVRTDRALDKLRSVLTRRGVTSTATALSALVLAQPLISAPAGLAATLAADALAAGGAGFFTSLMTTKIILTSALSALVAFWAGTYVGLSRQASPLSAALPSPSNAPLIASLRQENQRLTGKVSGLDAEVAHLTAANGKLAAQLAVPAPAPKNPTIGLARWEVQRSILSNLRQIEAARDQYHLEHGKPPESIGALVGRRNFIKAVRTVGGEDYSGLSMAEGAPLTVTTLDGVTVTFDPSGATTTKPDVPPEVTRAEELNQKVQPAIKKAVAAYQAAHEGKSPPNSDTLLAYFATPQEGADFAEFLEAQKAANAVGP